MARILFSDFREPAAGEAYEIAYDFLARSTALRDGYETFVFLAQRITEMVDHGEHNRIRMANRVISAYQNSRLAGDVVLAPQARVGTGFNHADRRFR
jgi:hypothetical protein